MLASMGLTMGTEYDKGYVIDGKEVLAYLQSDDRQSVQAAITYLNMQVALDPSFAAKFDLPAIYHSVYDRVKSILSNLVTNNLAKDKDYVKTQKLEYQSGLALLAALVADEANSQEWFEPSEATSLLVTLHAYLEEHDEEVRAA